MFNSFAAFLALLSTFSCLTSAWVLRAHLPPVPQLPEYNPSSLASSTTANLFKLGTTLSAPLNRRNTFEFSDLESGSYLLTVISHDYTFSPLRVDVNAIQTNPGGKPATRVDAWETFWGNEWGNKGEYRGGGLPDVTEEKVQPAVDPHVVNVEARPVAKKEYYMERSAFNALSFLKNPMVLMGLFSLVMIVGFPYLMENMDEESKQELEDMQKKGGLLGGSGGQSPSPAQSLQNFDLASWMAGKTSGASPRIGSDERHK